MINRYVFYIAISAIIIYGINFSLVYGYTDVGQLIASKYYLLLDNKTYTIFYFLHNLDTSNTDMSNLDYAGKISSISMEPNKNAMLISLDNILTNDELSVGFNSEIISADNGKFMVFVDGVEKGYAVSKAFGNDTVITVVTPNGTRNVEIIGTHAGPEFGSLAMMVTAISIIGIILISSKLRFQYSK